MRFTSALIIAMASVASAGSIATEKRTGGNAATCFIYCWQFCVAPNACGLCVEACMAVANPVEELDKSEFQRIADAEKPGVAAAQ